MNLRNLVAALAVAFLLAAPIGCATKTVRDIAAEEGVTASPELLYFGVLTDYNDAKKDALAYAALPSTTVEEIQSILAVLNGGTSDIGCFVGTTEPTCLDGSEGAIRAFESIRLAGGATPDRFQVLSFTLAAAAAQIRAGGGN